MISLFATLVFLRFGVLVGLIVTGGCGLGFMVLAVSLVLGDVPLVLGGVPLVIGDVPLVLGDVPLVLQLKTGRLRGRDLDG